MSKTNNVTPKDKRKILFVASEAQPFCATGGLADVCGSLPKAIQNLDKNIEICTILPLYSTISYALRKDFKFRCYTYISLAWRREYCGIFEYFYDGIKYYFVDNEKYFKRDSGEYGYIDDGERFAFFSKAVLEVLPMIDYFPDIIHLNDWQSALIPVYLKTIYWDNRYNKIRTILTIHNIEYQGRFGQQILTDVFGIDKKFKNLLTFDGDINVLKGAIITADKLTTVSPSYAEEIQMPEHSFGLYNIVRENSYKLKGILNGLDYDFYNPSSDNVIYANYDRDSIEKKKINKECLQREFNLEVNVEKPLLSICCRMTSAKGFDLIKNTIEKLINELDIQFVGVGAGEKQYEDFFRYLNLKYPKKVHISIGFSNEIGRKIYSGSDIYIMPSISEPCGLSQIIACKYGVVPIVRETGGLKDTIKDFGVKGGGNGYTFKDACEENLEYSIRRAVKDFQNKELWNKRVKKIMRMDFSWKKTAKEYLNFYREF